MQFFKAWVGVKYAHRFKKNTTNTVFFFPKLKLYLTQKHFPFIFHLVMKWFNSGFDRLFKALPQIIHNYSNISKPNIYEHSIHPAQHNKCITTAYTCVSYCNLTKIKKNTVV